MSLQDRAEVVTTGVEVAGVVLVMPPVGVFGMHWPSLNSSLSLQDTAEVVATAVVGVKPPVGVCGTHCPSFSSSLSLHDTAEVVTTGVVVVKPPVGVLGTHEPFSSEDPSEQALIARGVEALAGEVIRPPVGGASPHFGQKVAVEVIVVVEIV